MNRNLLLSIGLLIWSMAWIAYLVWWVQRQPSRIVGFATFNAVAIPGIAMILVWKGTPLSQAAFKAIVYTPAAILLIWLNNYVRYERPGREVEKARQERRRRPLTLS